MGRDELIANLVKDLAKKGIHYQPSDDLGNVVFKSADYEKRIHKDLFFRHTGLHSYKVNEGEHFFRLVPMDDQMFYMSWLKTVIEYSFNPKNRK